MKKEYFKIVAALLIMVSLNIACSSNSSEDEVDDPVTGTLHEAFLEFDTDETDIYLSGSNVVIETTGNPNHTTPYWGLGHPLYVAPTVATAMTPSLITGFDGSATLTVSTSPTLAGSTTNTSLGAIGISVSGAAIYNDQEGNGALDSAVGSLDYTGGHIGPGVYHYHLEPLAFTNDDEELAGIISADSHDCHGLYKHEVGKAAQLHYLVTVPGVNRPTSLLALACLALPWGDFLTNAGVLSISRLKLEGDSGRENTRYIL